VILFPDGTWRAYIYFGEEKQEETEDYELIVVVAEEGTFERGAKISELATDRFLSSDTIVVSRLGVGEEVELSILFPDDGQEVAWTTPVFGKVYGFGERPDLHLYLLVFPEESEGPWWVQGLPYIAPTGEWTGIAYFGRESEDVGDSFKLAAIITTQELNVGEPLEKLPSMVTSVQVSHLERK